MIGPLAGLADDVFGLFARYSGGLFGKRAPEYEGRNGGKFGSPEFFQDARAGDYRALARMEKEGYGAAWNQPFFQGAVEREIGENAQRARIAGLYSKNARRGATYTAAHGRAARIAAGSRLPRGLVTGSPMYGYSKFADNLWGKQARTGLKFGAPLAILGVATAPKGEMVKRELKALACLQARPWVAPWVVFSLVCRVRLQDRSSVEPSGRRSVRPSLRWKNWATRLIT